MIEDIKTFIDVNLIDNGSDEDVAEVCRKVRAEFGVQCDYACAGGFDSPGYDIDCYAIAFVDKAGKLGIVTHAHEIY